MAWSDVVSIVTTLIAVGAFYIAWKKSKPETYSIDAGAAEKYSELVDRAAKREGEYQNRIDTINARVGALECRQAELEGQVKQANERADKFENWAKRLAYQVKSMNGVPVPMEPETAKH